jgi:hypothetical protein
MEATEAQLLRVLLHEDTIVPSSTATPGADRPDTFAVHPGDARLVAGGVKGRNRGGVYKDIAPVGWAVF